MNEYNRLAAEVRQAGRYVRPLQNLRVSNTTAERRVRNLALRYGLQLLPQFGTALPSQIAATAPVTATAIPAAVITGSTTLDTLTFGVEVEFLHPTSVRPTQIVDALNALGLPCAFEGYNHINRPGRWKLVQDGSLRPGPGFAGLELVAPPLSGEEGLRKIGQALDVLVGFGCTINKSCGLHVHVGVSGQPVEFFRSLVRLYNRNEAVIDSLMAPSRRGTAAYFARPHTINEAALDRASSIDQVVLAVGQMPGRQYVRTEYRYRKCNLMSFWQHETVEFRQHQGTVEKTKVQAWVRFCLRLVLAASKGDATAAGDLLGLLSKLEATPEEFGFFATRYAYFKQQTGE